MLRLRSVGSGGARIARCYQHHIHDRSSLSHALGQPRSYCNQARKQGIVHPGIGNYADMSSSRSHATTAAAPTMSADVQSPAISSCVDNAKGKQTRDFGHVSVKVLKGLQTTLDNCGSELKIKGWVSSVRKHRNVRFVDITDGSAALPIQITLNEDIPVPNSFDKQQHETSDSTTQIPTRLTRGCSVVVSGKLEAHPNKPTELEVICTDINVIGTCDELTYPLQKKYHSPEFMRENVHLRSRANTTRAMLLVRNAASRAVNEFFQNRSFIQIHTPILTSNDCEGAGDMFHVSKPGEPNFFSAINETKSGKKKKQKKINREKNHLQGNIFDKDIGLVSETKGSIAVDSNLPSAAFLTVSGQLHAEIFACSLSNVYTFGPTFRAENSNTARHLAEFWMVEPEMAFHGLDDTVDVAEACVKHVLRHLLEHCQEELAFFDDQAATRQRQRAKQQGNADTQTKTEGESGGVLARIAAGAADEAWPRMTYSEALIELRKAPVEFGFSLEWGASLQTAHEKYLAQTVSNGLPVVVTDYPIEQKPFYSRANEDGRTTAAFDILVPQIGELIGGSVREERLDVLQTRVAASGMDEESIKWYMDLRRYGTVPHAGWGMGFERLILFATGIENIRDAIPIPRHPNNLKL